MSDNIVYRGEARFGPEAGQYGNLRDPYGVFAEQPPEPPRPWWLDWQWVIDVWCVTWGALAALFVFVFVGSYLLKFLKGVC